MPCPHGLGNHFRDYKAGHDTECYDLTCERGQKKNADDSTCEDVLCTENHHVYYNTCVPCEHHLVRKEGDNAHHHETRCYNPCAANFHVVQNECTACVTGRINPAGDDPTGSDTSCHS